MSNDDSSVLRMVAWWNKWFKLRREDPERAQRVLNLRKRLSADPALAKRMYDTIMKICPECGRDTDVERHAELCAEWAAELDEEEKHET